MKSSIFALSALFFGFIASNSYADLVYTSSSFQNVTITQNDAFGFAITSEIMQDGEIAGTVSASLAYGGGTNPFNDGSNWGPSAGALRIYGESSGNHSGIDTADGSWQLSVTPVSGFRVDGMTVFSNGTVFGNPDFLNVNSNGTINLFDEGNGNDLIANHSDGDVLANGGNLDFVGGADSNGISPTIHSKNWAMNVENGTSLDFDFRVGFDETINTIGAEAIWLDVQLTAIPEPAACSLLSIIAIAGLARRRRI